MEKVRVEFGFEAHESFEILKKGSPYISPLAFRFYNELFEIPPEAWGRMRRELGNDTFIPEKHCIFDIRAIVEDTSPIRTLNVTHFESRKKGPK